MTETIVTSKNFALMLNLGKISKDTLSMFDREIGNYTKEITEMTIRESQHQETIKQIETTKETLGVGTDLGSAVVNKIINEGATQDVIFKSRSIEETTNNEERVVKFYDSNDSSENVLAEGSAQSFGKDLEKDIKDLVKDNEEILRQNQIFTDEEFNKILKSGKDGIPHMFDYDLGTGGNAKDMELDLRILDKCCGCTLTNSDGYIFKKFLIIDDSGNAVNPKLINKGTIKYIINYGVQGENKVLNKESIERHKKIAIVREQGRKLAKLRGNANLLKLLKRAAGADTIKREFNEYTKQLNVIKYAKRTTKVIEGGVKTVYIGTKYIILQRTNKAYAKAKNEYLKSKDNNGIKTKKALSLYNNKNHEENAFRKFENATDVVRHPNDKNELKKALSLYKKKKQKENAFRKFENVADVVRHPIKNVTRKVGSAIATKFKSSLFAKRIAERFNKSAWKKLYDTVYKGLNNIISMPFKILGRVVNPIATIIRMILVKALIIMIPIIIFIVVLSSVSFVGLSGATTSGVVAIMPLANMEDFVSYQTRYDTLDDNFLKSLENYLGTYATRLNLKGEQIVYGVNGQNNEDGMQNNDYQNGMYYKFITDNEHAGRSSNIEDLIAIMSIMMTQSQADNPDVSLKVIEWLYNISHNYTFVESPLYACDSGCHLIHYECNDNYHDYSDTDIKYSPFHALRMTGDEYEIKKAENYCVVCKANVDAGVPNTNCVVAEITNPTLEDCYGCIANTDKCFHGNDGNIGRQPGFGCDSYYAYYECPGHVRHDKEGNEHTSYCAGPLGCKGYYICNGHIHYHCEGHVYKCCMGHTDIQMNVQIKFYNELKDIINGYNFGVNDIYYEDVVSKRKEN